MDHKKVQKYLSYAMKGLFSVLGLLILMAIISLEMNKKPQAEIDAILAEKQREVALRVERIADGLKVRPKEERHLPDPWPASMNVAYPEIELIDHNGKEKIFSDFIGKVIILDFIDMSSPFSQAQSGSVIMGAYGQTTDIDRLSSTFADIFRKEMGYNPDDEILELKVIVYAEDGSQASVDDAEKWAAHFDLMSAENVVVAVPKIDLRAPSTQGIIGGFQLLDRQMRLRVDSTGTLPKHNLRMTLIPLADKLAKQ